MIFTKTIDQFSSLDRHIRSGLFEKKYKILFADLDIQKAFYYLLENRCPKCDDTPFANFHTLKEHVRKTHELFYCEICTDNLKIFSSERRCYTRSELATHRRVGDADNKSHKGHPRCEYCELRYLDKDELFRHLRREHYFCHLCDADGKNLYFGAISEMRVHFKTDHFLCEEPECLEEEFFAVFRTEIDLKAHRATVHSRGMSRAEVRQARTLEIEFSYGPRGRGGGGDTHENRGQRGGRGNRRNDPQSEFESREITEPEIVQQPQIRIDASSEEQFPSLAGPSLPMQSQVQLANSVRHVVYARSGLAKTKENFPSLGGGSIESTQTKQQNKQQSASSLFKAPPKQQQKQQKQTQQQSSAPKSQLNKVNDFPTLPQNSASKLFSTPAPSTQKPSTSSTKASVVPSKASDFPSLGPLKGKSNKNERLMEDMIIPSNSNIDKQFVSSKHRNLVNDYVSVASQINKVQLVKQKEDVQLENSVQSVPKLNSSNNFPSLGVGSSTNDKSSSNKLPQWITVKPTNNNNQKKLTNEKIILKVPQNKSQSANGLKKSKDEPKKVKDKEKPNVTVNNKEKENMKVPIPPGFKKSDINSFPKYTPLPEASKRNQALLEECEKILQTHEQMQEFKLLSQMFRNGDYFARSYYESCKGVLGEKFNSIFPELIALLPDIEKQQVKI